MNKNSVIFAQLWKDPAYIDLHRVKDSIKPMQSSHADREAAWRQYDHACFLINEYERVSGVK